MTTLLENIIEAAHKAAVQERTRANRSAFHSVDSKRAIATVATKLEEALMWQQRAVFYLNQSSAVISEIEEER